MQFALEPQQIRPDRAHRGTPERQNAQKPVPDINQITPEDVQQCCTRTSHTGTPAFCSSMHFLYL